MFNVLKFILLHALGILCNGQRINHGLNVATKETLQVVCGIADAVIGNTTLWEVVCADFGATVAGRYQALTTVGDIIYILLVLLIINKGVNSTCSADVHPIQPCLRSDHRHPSYGMYPT